MKKKETKPAYLVILQGQGDTEVKLVEQEVWHWFVSPPPAFETGKYVFDELPVVSEKIRQAILETCEKDQEHLDPENREPCQLNVTSGSWDNDRMLECPPSLCLFSDMGDTDVIAAARRWAKANGYKITDKFEGCIY